MFIRLIVCVCVYNPHSVVASLNDRGVRFWIKTWMPWIPPLIDRSVSEMSASAALSGRIRCLNVLQCVWVCDRRNKACESAKEKTINGGEKGVRESYSVIRDQHSSSRHKQRRSLGTRDRYKQARQVSLLVCVYVWERVLAFKLSVVVNIIFYMHNKLILSPPF